MAQNGLGREFLEKYIPYVVNLTEMDYEDMVKSLWDEVGLGRVEIPAPKGKEPWLDQKEILYIPRFVPHNIEAEEIFEIKMEAHFVLQGISIRKVRIFMEEIKCFLLQNKDFCTEKNRKTVMRFLFIKHFYDSYYKKFGIGQSLTDTLLFQFRGQSYTMDQLLSGYKKKEISHEEILELLSEEENKENYLILSLFEHHSYEEEELNRENIANESVAALKRKQESQKTDRIIWNLLGNGKSEYTNIEIAVAKFIDAVLDTEIVSQEKAWGEYYANSIHKRTWKDNGTIFRRCIDEYLPLFQGFQIVGESEKNWVRLLQFYDRMNAQKNITVEFIENLNYCDLTKRKVFLQAIQLFCGYKIVGNVNQEKGYRTFFHHYFSAVFSLGYSTSYAFEPWKLELNRGIDSKDMKYVKELLDDMERRIESEKKELVISEAVEECEWIKKFIQKNRQLIETVSVKKPNEVRIETNIHSVWQNQEEYDRLMAYIAEEASGTDQKVFEEDLKINRKVFYEEVEKSYREGRINPAELKELMQKYQNPGEISERGKGAEKIRDSLT